MPIILGAHTEVLMDSTLDAPVKGLWKKIYSPRLLAVFIKKLGEEQRTLVDYLTRQLLVWGSGQVYPVTLSPSDEPPPYPASRWRQETAITVISCQMWAASPATPTC